MESDWPQRLVEAREIHRAGRLNVARAAYRLLLNAAPEDADVLGLLGVLDLQEGRFGEAEALLRQAVAAGGEPRIYLRNLNNLLALLQRIGNSEAARELVAGDLPDWPEGAVPDASERQTVLSLCRTLLLLDRAEAARQLLDRAMPEPGDDAKALGLAGQILLALGENAPAAATLERAAKLAPDEIQPLIALSYAQDQLGQSDAARATAKRIAIIGSVYSAESQPSQHATVMVLNPFPRSIVNPNVNLRGLHFSANYGSQVASYLQADFRFLSLFGNLTADEIPAQLPEADIILNNIVNSEPMNIPGRLDIVRATVDRIGRPVINHPDQVFQTTRQKNALLLGGVPNLKVPRIERYRTDLASIEAIVADIGERFAYPVILRTTTGHQGSDSVLIEEGKAVVLLPTPADVRDHLERCNWHEFYAVEFVDLKRKDGFYRQQRAVIMGREIIVSRSSIYREWMVTSWRSKSEGIEFYRDNPQTIDECNRIVRDPEVHLGGAAMRALEAIRDRIPFDMFGVDFEVDREGRMVFFEAGAAMILQPLNLAREPMDVRLPMEPLIRINDAFREMVLRGIGGAG